MPPPSDADGPAADWWRKNEAIRESLGLPRYDPPRLADGTILHTVTDTLESATGCEIRIVGVNTSYPDDLEVRIDGERAFDIGRHRTDAGNTIFEMRERTFREAIEDHIDRRSIDE